MHCLSDIEPQPGVRHLKLPPLNIARPASVEEAVALLALHDGEAKIISGGQSLMPMLAFRLAAPEMLIDLALIPGLDSIASDTSWTTIGARCTWRMLEQDRHLVAAQPLLCSALPHIAHYQIRNRGTVGGSLAHADPAAELPAVAVTCDAMIDIVGTSGSRSVAAGDFFLAPMVAALDQAEMIVAIRLPAWPSKRRYAFSEFARRKGDFALAGVALLFDLDGEGRIASPAIGAFGIGDVPMRLREAEAALTGALPSDEIFASAVAACGGLQTNSDLHADSDYRRALVQTLLGRCLGRAGGDQK